VPGVRGGARGGGGAEQESTALDEEAGGQLGGAGGGVGSMAVGNGVGATGSGGKGGGSGGGGGLAGRPPAFEHFEAVIPREAPPGASVLATAPGGLMVCFRLPSQLPAHRRVTVRLQPTEGAVWRGEVGEACGGVPAASLA
jgi:hypothetical protein